MNSPDESSIRHQNSNRIDTFRDDGSAQEVHLMPETAVSAVVADLTGPTGQVTRSPLPHYRAAVTTNANSVLAAIDTRRPDQTIARRNLLLFFCQGHYLAGAGSPLFAEPIYATASGIHVDVDPDEPTEGLNNRQLGFIGSTLHRYADMTTADLWSLVQISTAWQLARLDGDDPRIEWTWLSDWFRRPAERQGAPTSDEAADFAARHKERLGADTA